MTGSPAGGGLSGRVSGKTPGIELSEGVGKGTKVYDVMVGLRTFPSLEKPLVSRGSPDVAGNEEDPVDVDDEDNSDDEGAAVNERVLLGDGWVVDESTLEF